MAIKVDRAEAPLANFYVGALPWLRYRACADVDGEVFFDNIESARGEEKREAEAKARGICKTCPVRWDCAHQVMKEEGSAQAGRYGFRGCLSPTQRRMVYRQGGLRRRDPAKIPLR